MALHLVLGDFRVPGWSFRVAEVIEDTRFPMAQLEAGGLVTVPFEAEMQPFVDSIRKQRRLFGGEMSVDAMGSLLLANGFIIETGPPALVDLLVGEGTFVRSSESSHYAGSEDTLDWVAADTKAIDDRGDGNSGVLFFRPITNLVANSEDVTGGGWTPSGATPTESTQFAPDGDLDANELAYTASTNANLNTTSPGGETTPLVNLRISGFAKAPSGTEETRLRIDSNSATTNSPVIPLTTVWQRFEIGRGNGVSGTGERFVWVNSTDGAARTIHVWGAQYEDNTTYPGPYVRTSGAQATRSADSRTYAPGDVTNELLTGPSRTPVYLYWTEADRTNGDENHIMSIDSADESVRFEVDGTGLRVVAVEGGVIRAASNYLTVSRTTKIEADVYPNEGRVAVTGALTGDGIGPVGTPWAWTAPVSGLRLGGIFGGSGELDGVIVGSS